jgi:hypothetical protein
MPLTSANAASPEMTDAFASSDQGHWRVFSQSVIQELEQKMGHLSPIKTMRTMPVVAKGCFTFDVLEFEQLYDFCCIKRAEIAVVLGHEPIRKYGVRRDEYYAAEESFARSDDVKQAWRFQKKAVFKAVEKMAAPVFAAMIAESETERSENQRDLCVYSEIYSGLQCAKINIKANQNGPYDEPVSAAQQLSTIYFKHNPIDEKDDLIIVHYADTNKYKDIICFAVANEYYQACLKWHPEDGIEEFLVRLGRLQHLMAHLLPVKRGNAAIMGWLEQAIAGKCSVELGNYTQKDEDGDFISWDFKALVTPNREEYARWYAKHAFESCGLAPALEMPPVASLLA